jgi:hypothetical protein
MRQVRAHGLRARAEEGWVDDAGDVDRGLGFVWRWKVRMTIAYNAYIIAEAAEK